MKTILKLLIAAAVLNATARTGMAAWRYYQFKDGAQQTLVFGADATPAQLHESILLRARALGLQVEPEDVEVTREGLRTTATASYTESVELLPRYMYPLGFSFDVEAMAMNPLLGQRRSAPR